MDKFKPAQEISCDMVIVAKVKKVTYMIFCICVNNIYIYLYCDICGGDSWKWMQWAQKIGNLSFKPHIKCLRLKKLKLLSVYLLQKEK